MTRKGLTWIQAAVPGYGRESPSERGKCMQQWLEFIFDLAEIVGTVAFAASAAMIAIDRKLDLFGVLFIGITAAVGGGIMRDLFLGYTPPSAFRNPVYVAMAAATALAVFLFAFMKRRLYIQHYRVLDKVINWLDAVGLGIFGVIGVETAIGMGHGDKMFLCVFMGLMPAVGGGILRDVFTQVIPAVLNRRVYAVASIAGCVVYYLLRHTAMGLAIAMLIGMGVTVVIRLCASHYKWHLPRINLEDADAAEPKKKNGRAA